MTDQPITHKSAQINLADSTSFLEPINKNGVKCNGTAIANCHNLCNGVTLTWNFDWSELKNTGVDGLSGHITVTSPQNFFNPQKIQLDCQTTKETVVTNIYIGSRHTYPILIFEYTLHPRITRTDQTSKSKEVLYEEMFFPSDKNDTILVIDGKKLHVNKVFLSYHSDFFSALFSSNFKEGQLDEIPIQDITFEDFGLLMSIIYTKPAHPDDSNVEKLLELADKFLIPAVIGHVEYHLLHYSNISSEMKMWMADQY